MVPWLNQRERELLKPRNPTLGPIFLHGYSAGAKGVAADRERKRRHQVRDVYVQRQITCTEIAALKTGKQDWQSYDVGLR